MDYTINQIVDYFAKSSIEFVDIITNQVLPHHTNGNRTTARGVSGIVIPLSGSANFSFNQTVYKMKECTIVHAGSQMNIEIETIGEKPWEYAVIHYKTLHNAPLDLKNIDFAAKVMQMDKIKEYVYQLIKYSSEPGSFSTFQVKVIFYNLIKEILEQAKKHLDDKNTMIIPKAITYIHDNFAEEFSIAELARMLGMERRRFSELFEQHKGLSPIQYITEYRIRIAREMLRVGNHSIAEIAEKVGYQDHFYFSRVFKKHVGMSPSKYRKYMVEKCIYI